MEAWAWQMNEQTYFLNLDYISVDLIWPNLKVLLLIHLCTVFFQDQVNVQPGGKAELVAG